MPSRTRDKTGRNQDRHRKDQRNVLRHFYDYSYSYRTKGNRPRRNIMIRRPKAHPLNEPCIFTLCTVPVRSSSSICRLKSEYLKMSMHTNTQGGHKYIFNLSLNNVVQQIALLFGWRSGRMTTRLPHYYSTLPETWTKQYLVHSGVLLTTS